ncbi:MAG: hypothetical protein JXQ95_19140 [Alteromonas stellipolaris]|uniref:hypothetical protein n=1 Tax=Alteromonas stellipolaris TaxID=233316 RepID=UPI003B8D7012
MSSFFDKIKKNSIKTPTQRGFCLSKWDKCWEGCKDGASERDKKLHFAGVIIFKLLEEIRNELKALYKEQAPDIDNAHLLLAYVSLSNRERAIVSANQQTKNKNIHSATIISKTVGNEITLQEVSDGAVDGLEKAIYLCKNRINKYQAIKKGRKPLDILSFIQKEAYFSEIYGVYENYWHAILWNDYSLIEVDKEKKLYIVEQPMDKYEIGSYVSLIRKSRLGAQSAALATSPDILKSFDENKYITVVKCGRNERLICKDIKKANDEIRYMNADWQTNKIFLPDNFGSEILNRQNSLGFSINEALEVFRNLIILSFEYAKKFPNNFNVPNLKKLSEFCPKIDKNKLKIAISKSTGMTTYKTLKILDFIEYKAFEKQDLWCHPIISASEKEYALVTSSLATPVIIRVVEHWLVSLGEELQDKGIVYEHLIIDGLNRALKKNHYISDLDYAVSRRIRFNNSEEEIDLLFRIGDLIVIGEAKSIVTTDSPISNYRTLETLKHAAKQIKRKMNFIESNLESVFVTLDWNYDDNAKYEFIGCIINSGRMYVGLDIEGVPVCDEKILLKYFQSNEIPLVSVFDEKTREAKDLAWLILYSNFGQLKGNLRKYLSNPPQIFEKKEHFEYKTINIPYITEESYKIVFNRFIPKDLTVNDRVNMKHSFPIGKIADYDKKIEKVDFIV